MTDKAKAMVMASFLGDSLALGAHWIYDTRVIKENFGRVETLLKPPSNSFHATRDKGEFTHYGDQALVLLQSVSSYHGFDLQDFFQKWQQLFENYDGYVDQATRMTLSNIRSGKSAEESGSPSNDLAGASRIAPIVYAHRADLEKVIKAAETQTRMTHRDAHTVESAAFFGRVVFHVLEGTAPVEALTRVTDEHFRDTRIADWVKQGLDSKDEDTVETITRFGQTCHTPDAFPGVVHLISRYEDDLKEALVQSVMAGGDSAARNMMAGMVLGARVGYENLPQDWLSGLKKRDEILSLLKEF